VFDDCQGPIVTIVVDHQNKKLHEDPHPNWGSNMVIMDLSFGSTGFRIKHQKLLIV
jgi:hypothetical protein